MLNLNHFGTSCYICPSLTYTGMATHTCNIAETTWKPGLEDLIDFAMRLGFTLISSFAFGYSIPAPPVKITWITWPTCMLKLNAVQPWHNNLDRAQDAPHNIGGEVLVMPEYQHVQDPIKKAYSCWYDMQPDDGTRNYFDDPLITKGPFNHPYRILGPRKKWPRYANGFGEKEFLAYRLFLDLRNAYGIPYAVDGEEARRRRLLYGDSTPGEEGEEARSEGEASEECEEQKPEGKKPPREEEAPGG